MENDKEITKSKEKYGASEIQAIYSRDDHLAIDRLLAWEEKQG